MSRNTDVYHITVAGTNPHDIASKLDEEGSPFRDPAGRSSVSQQFTDNGQLVGGVVDVWGPEHLTPAQEACLQNCSHVIDVRHAWPE